MRHQSAVPNAPAGSVALESAQMNSVAAVLATASLPSSLSIVWSCRDRGEHHTEALKLSKADEQFCSGGDWLAPEMVRAGPISEPARLGSSDARGAHFPCLPVTNITG